MKAPRAPRAPSHCPGLCRARGCADRREVMGGSLPKPKDGCLPRRHVSKGSFSPPILATPGVSYLFVGHCDWEQLDKQPVRKRSLIPPQPGTSGHWAAQSSSLHASVHRDSWQNRPEQVQPCLMAGFCLGLLFRVGGSSRSYIQARTQSSSEPVHLWWAFISCDLCIPSPCCCCQLSLLTKPCTAPPASSTLQLNKYQHQQKSSGQKARTSHIPCSITALNSIHCSPHYSQVPVVPWHPATGSDSYHTAWSKAVHCKHTIPAKLQWN